jgi:hypothetical protein
MPACDQYLSKPSRQCLSFSLRHQRLALTQGLAVALRNNGRSQLRTGSRPEQQISGSAEDYPSNGGSLQNWNACHHVLRQRQSFSFVDSVRFGLWLARG